MFNKKMIQLIPLSCIVAASLLQPVFAQTGTAIGKITSFSTGWNADAFGVTTNAPVINPAGCSSTSSYQAISSAPGYKSHYAAVLTAYSTGSQVVLIISNTTCTQGFPTIIGVNVTPAT